jgi:hypothetical protein
MVYVAHPATGVHRIPDDWLDGFAPSGFRLATIGEIAAWHAERGLGAPPASSEVDEGIYCPCCLRRIPTANTDRREHREACASGPLAVWVHHCAACGAALAVEVAEVADPGGADDRAA